MRSGSDSKSTSAAAPSGSDEAAFDLERNARVALKLLHRSDPGSLYRLKRGFRGLADLSHAPARNFSRVPDIPWV
jgi:hypothetical protein